jgi:hypothetical protein
MEIHPPSQARSHGSADRVVRAVLHDTSRETFDQFESTEESPAGCPTFE